MSTNLIANEKASIGHNNINSIVHKAIVKENGKNTRILYAGANPNLPGTMVVCKLIELFRGHYFYEETVFNPFIKSVHTTLTSTNEKFHKIVKAQDKLHEITYKPVPEIVAGTSYARELQGGEVFHDTIIKDYRSNQNFVTSVLNTFYYWRIRRHLNIKY